LTGTVGGILLLGRILFSVFFLSSGVAHVKRRHTMVEDAKASGFPVPLLVGWPAGLWLLAAVVSIAAGVWPEIGALMIAAFVILAGLLFHRYWKVDDPVQRQMQQMYFLRNITFLGSALSLFAIFMGTGESLRFVLIAPILNVHL
jgi:putative oxidoreductase